MSDPSKSSTAMATTITDRQLGEKKLCPVGFGCMSLSFAYGFQPDEATAQSMLHRALDLGYQHLDTARLYGLGHNEALIGKTLKQERDRFFLASKAGIQRDDKGTRIDCRPETLRTACEESLRSLQTDFIDLYYLHRHDVNTPLEDSIGTLTDLIREGKIGGIGLSEVSSSTLRQAASIHPITAVQNEYSLWTRNPELGVLEACAELGTAFVAFSPLGRGALAQGVSDASQLGENDFRSGMPRFMADNWPSNLQLINQLGEIAKQQNVSAAQLALSWVLSRGEHVHIIPGTSKPKHLSNNIDKWQWQPDAKTLNALDKLINQQTVKGHRYSEAMRSGIDTEDFC